MSRSVTQAIRDALAARRLVARDFLWLVARNRDTGELAPYGWWSDLYTASFPVMNPDTGLAETRLFEGAGQLISISDIPLVSNITVRDVTIDLSQIHDQVAEAVRGFDVKRAPVEIYRGLFDPATRALVQAAQCRFVGFVDDVDITTPSENEDGTCQLVCRSHTQEMTRSNPAKRSHEDQILRDPDDEFYKDAAVVGDWELSWGRENARLSDKEQVDAKKPTRFGI